MAGAALSGTEYLILDLLVSNAGKEMYGLEMVERSNGKLKKGTVYVLLGRLEEKGFVKGRSQAVEGSAIPRRLYRLTGLGHRIYALWKPVAQVGGLRGAVA